MRGLLAFLAEIPEAFSKVFELSPGGERGRGSLPSPQSRPGAIAENQIQEAGFEPDMRHAKDRLRDADGNRSPTTTLHRRIL
jgi:hypothetical protein